jgi:hypothetical protein
LHIGTYIANKLERQLYKTRQDKSKKSEWHNSYKIASWEQFCKNHIRLN